MAIPFSNRVFPWILSLGVLPLFAVACGTSKNDDSNFDEPATGAPGSTAGSTGNDPGGPGPALGTVGDDGGLGGNLGDGATCAESSAAATQKPVDLVFMIDTSGSMLNFAGSADPTKKVTKWEAVRSAVEAFLGEKKSDGLGVSLSFFPLNRTTKGLDTSCSSRAECSGANNGCAIGKCRGHDLVCSSSANCPNAAPCDPAGVCRARGQICGTDAECAGTGGNECVPITAPFCTQGTSCSVADYSTPVVPYGLLPAAATNALTALAARTPRQGTPTVPALQGALTYAQKLAAEHTDRRVAVVLVTDGVPQGCEGATPSNDIVTAASIAKKGFESAANVPTYVLGVFAPAEATQAGKDLDNVAMAGGSTKATIVKTDENVADKFLDALGAIRNGLLGCDFDLPQGDNVDFAKVSVKITAGAGTVSLPPRVSSEATCGTDAGWHFDGDPAAVTPKRVHLCPTTCAAVKADPQAKVDIVLGCKSVSVIR